MIRQHRPLMLPTRPATSDSTPITADPRTDVLFGYDTLAHRIVVVDY